MMVLDLGSTLTVLAAFALVAGPVVTYSLNRIAHLTHEELKIKERLRSESDD